jgi:hypothetical protein
MAGRPGNAAPTIRNSANFPSILQPDAAREIRSKLSPKANLELLAVLNEFNLVALGCVNEGNDRSA